MTGPMWFTFIGSLSGIAWMYWRLWQMDRDDR